MPMAFMIVFYVYRIGVVVVWIRIVSVVGLVWRVGYHTATEQGEDSRDR